MPVGLGEVAGECQICYVQGPRDTCVRLAQMGFIPGAPVKVLCRGGSAVVVMVHDSRVALDKTVAFCIKVTRRKGSPMFGNEGDERNDEKRKVDSCAGR